jgi:hypothetical protein
MSFASSSSPTAWDRQKEKGKTVTEENDSTSESPRVLTCRCIPVSLTLQRFQRRLGSRKHIGHRLAVLAARSLVGRRGQPLGCFGTGLHQRADGAGLDGATTAGRAARARSGPRAGLGPPGFLVVRPRPRAGLGLGTGAPCARLATQGNRGVQGQGATTTAATATGRTAAATGRATAVSARTAARPSSTRVLAGTAARAAAGTRTRAAAAGTRPGAAAFLGRTAAARAATTAGASAFATHGGLLRVKVRLHIQLTVPTSKRGHCDGFGCVGYRYFAQF